MNGDAARLLGRWGEAVAAEDLRRKGWRLVAARMAVPFWRNRPDCRK